MTQSAMLRPAWTPATIALMVLGFIAYWPLGLAMLAYILWGDKLGNVKTEVNKMTDSMFSNCRRAVHTPSSTGNAAFDDWRTKELDRLNEERRKLDTMRDEFDGYVRELRRAKDQGEFDRFMTERNRPAPSAASSAEIIEHS